MYSERCNNLQLKHYVVLYCIILQIYELSSGKMLCSILFSFGLTCLAVDLAERCLFVGGSNGKISRVNLYTKVRFNVLC